MWIDTRTYMTNLTVSFASVPKAPKSSIARLGSTFFPIVCN